MIAINTDAAAAMWADFCADRGLTEQPMPAAEAFGDHAEMADELLALVLDGTKRATASAADAYVAEGDPLPAVGDRWIACDGRGDPRCIIETTEVRVGPLSSVDDQFAWDEGEGDRTRDDWLAGHTAFFQRTATPGTFTFSDDMPTAFERFALVWPPDVAD